MIRRYRSPLSLAPFAAWLAFAWLASARLMADETISAPAIAQGERPAEAVGNTAARTVAPEASESATVAPPTEPPKRATDEIHGLLNLGVSLTERGDFEAAEIAYRQVLNAPKVAETDLKTALLGLAHMHRKQGALTKAAAIYEHYLREYSGDERTPYALLELGRTLRGLGVPKLAIARFYNVINSTLKMPGEGFDHYQVLAKTAQFEIAETHFLAGEFVEATKFYTRLRLLDLAPVDRARAHFKAAYALRLQGDLEGAVATLQAYIDQWPVDENIPEARYVLAITLRELKRPQEALAATLELLRTEQTRVATDPKRWAYWQRRTGNQLANDFFETGDTLHARAIYAGLLELSTETAWRLPIAYQLALCYERLGINDRARTSYQSIVDAAGANPPADLAELVKMAAWRIEHLDWRERVNQQLSTFFESTHGRQAAALPPASPLNTAATP